MQPSLASQLSLQIDDVSAPSFSLQRIRAQIDFAAQSRFNLLIADAQIQGRHWQNLQLTCTRLNLASNWIECSQGQIQIGEKFPFNFRYQRAATSFAQFNLLPAAGEQWQIQTRSAGEHTEAKLSVKNGRLARLNPALSATKLTVSQGTLNAEATLQLNHGVAQSLNAMAALAQVAFSDAAGARAGEKLNLSATLNAQHPARWDWRTEINWQAGELYWQPLYFASGARQLQAQGSLDSASLTLTRGELNWPGVGQVKLRGAWDRQAQRIDQLQAAGTALNLDNLYSVFIKPWLGDGQGNKLQWSGRGDLQLDMQQGEIKQLSAALHDAGVKQEAGLFEFEGMQANLAWSPTAARDNKIAVKRGSVGKLPLGAFSVQASFAPDLIAIAPITVPILDGALRLDGINARRSQQDWQWTVSAGLQPISMRLLSEALQLPIMHGTLSAVIPQLSYADQSLSVGGALLFKVFDGTIVVKDLRARALAGAAPQVHANIDMRNLDLDLLTRAFSFGAMLGRLDVTVHDLELFGWRPVQFNARVESSAGDYPRKISQRAVENITALSGGGGAAAIQKSFLRFFDQFGYERIALACVLRNGVCQMSGIEDKSQGYLIVKGGGIPSLSVIGYNRQVGWDELLARIKAATQGGKPIVQ